MKSTSFKTAFSLTCTVFSVILLSSAPVLIAQESPASTNAAGSASEMIKVPLTDANRPVTLKVHLIYGSITVKAYKGKEVLIQPMPSEKSGKSNWSSGREREREREAKESATQGLKRIPNTSMNLSVEEENNFVTIQAGHPNRHGDLMIQTPTNTSLKLKTINNGDIVVEGVNGEIEVENINGNITLKQISGSAIAHALNGTLTASFVSLATDKPTSFSSMNGKVDITLPASTKANVLMKTQQGEVYSDFDIKLGAQQAKVEETRDKNGKYRMKMDNTMRGTINGGGAELQCTNFNGDVYIRSAK